jgi:2-polyprenyl-3-methyl-5-hydroxy-6-metoxy-1,4-benzoquinol methylase
MAFPLSHWKNPRKTIATRFEHNDIAYATHGAIIAMEALKAIDLPPSKLNTMTLLDYGCGTGRAARVMSKLFAKVYAYDPVKECINLAYNECEGIDFPNVEYFSDITLVPKADIAICINVIEHLVDTEAQILIDTIKEKVVGPTYMWYSTSKNKNIIDKYLSEEQIQEDAASQGGITIRSFLFANT